MIFALTARKLDDPLRMHTSTQEQLLLKLIELQIRTSKVKIWVKVKVMGAELILVPVAWFRQPRRQRVLV